LQQVNVTLEQKKLKEPTEFLDSKSYSLCLEVVLET